MIKIHTMRPHPGSSVKELVATLSPQLLVLEERGLRGGYRSFSIPRDEVPGLVAFLQEAERG